MQSVFTVFKFHEIFQSQYSPQIYLVRIVIRGLIEAFSTFVQKRKTYDFIFGAQTPLLHSQIQVQQRIWILILPEGDIVLSFLQNVNFREGYSQTLHFFFNEATAISEPTVCDGSAILTIKIVPEYLTWTGKEGDNWNNDNNWKRSVKTEIYKSDYTDDSNSQGFVPLKYSKVTVLKKDSIGTFSSPWLYQLNGIVFLEMDNTNYIPLHQRKEPMLPL